MGASQSHEIRKAQAQAKEETIRAETIPKNEQVLPKVEETQQTTRKEELFLDKQDFQELVEIVNDLASRTTKLEDNSLRKDFENVLLTMYNYTDDFFLMIDDHMKEREAALKREIDDLRIEIGKLTVKQPAASPCVSGACPAVSDLQTKMDNMQKEMSELWMRLIDGQDMTNSDDTTSEDDSSSYTPERQSPIEVEQITQFGTIIVMGGKQDGKVTSNMYILRGDKSKWDQLRTRLPCVLDGSVFLDGHIYIFGSRKTYKLINATHWERCANMNSKRDHIANSSLVFQGCIWVCGGAFSSGACVYMVEKYDPQQNKWTIMPRMIEERKSAAAAVCQGKIFICGGWTGSYRNRLLKSCEYFDPLLGCWSPFYDMPEPLHGHSMIATDENTLIVLGGYHTSELSSVWEIRPQDPNGNSTWKQLKSMNQTRSYLSAIKIGQEIFAIGGGSNKSVEIFNGETWRTGAELPVRCQELSSIVLPA